MPNGYTVVPNVIPGNVTIGGNLTVQGDQLQVGNIAPFLRAGKSSGSLTPFVGGNMGFDLASIDIARPAWALLFDAGGRNLKMRELNAASALMDTALPQALLTDYTAHAHTGTVTEDTIYTKLIRGGVMGANGGLLGRILVASTVQGGVATSIRVRFGANLMVSWSFAAPGTFILTFFTGNRNSQAQQINYSAAQSIAGAAPSGGSGATAVDTSADVTATITVQNGAAGDTQSFDFTELRLQNSFGPV